MPFGIYRYCRLPMGMIESPDIATEMMHSVLDGIDGIDGIEFSMDDIRIFSSTWANHLSLLSTVYTRLQDVGFTINPLKCEWAVQETDFLGHLRSFLGMDIYYCDMWPRRTHVFAPLTEHTGNALSIGLLSTTTSSYLWTSSLTKETKT